jgi:ribosomal protein S12 methylthiotransferase accessory factor
LNPINKISSSYVSIRTGIIKRIAEVKLHHYDPEVFSYASIMTDTSKYSPHKCSTRNGGAGLTQEEGLMATIGEGIERYCCNFYYENDLFYGTYNEYKNKAVNPSDWILYSDLQYNSRNFPFKKFDENTKIRWVEGKSWISNKKKLIPASMVYIPYYHSNKEDVICPGISTGLSCRSSMEEAILYGLYECIERDAFTIFWLNQLETPIVDMENIDNQELKNIFNQRFKKNDIKYNVYDITLDISVPTYFTSSIGTTDIGKMYCVGSASNLNGNRALLKSLIETAQSRPYLRYVFNENRKWRIKKNFININTFDDHARVYTQNPSLIKNLKIYSYKNKIKTKIDNKSEGTIKDLRKVLSMLKYKGYDVLIIDLTTEDVHDLGFHVVKVLIPGLQPLHGDHRFPFLGGERLYQIPYKMKKQTRPTEETEIFTYPHPFP